MKRSFFGFCAAAALALLDYTGQVQAISVLDYAVRVSALVQVTPPQITLSWPADPDATGYTVYRKLRDETIWGTPIILATNATSYVDSNIVVGATYEYRIYKTANESGSSYTGHGYIYTGIQAPLVEERGKLLLLVDNTITNALAFELARLQLDLAGDGWSVLRRDVSRSATPPQIKAVITNEYQADPVNLKTVFLFGHVPVPYSGLLNPDGHPDHYGAWPADVYYADMNGLWTDTTVSNVNASRIENRNVPGDGKFDQTYLPSNLELQVGRVDLWNMPAFPQSEVELLRQYLNKTHNFRMRYVNPPRRGLVDEHFGTFGGEAFGVNGYRNFAPFFGSTNINTGAWFSTLSANSYLWGYACGPGSYTSEGGVGTTSDFAQNPTQVTFTMHFGSYFGDYDAQNNLMRAQLANRAGGLTCAWAGRPHWQFHHMALGETIGFSALTSENYVGTLYSGNYGSHYAHVNLLGDPTLRMHMVAPPSALVVTDNGSGGRDLHWRSSPDSVLGYLVYGADSAAEPFARLSDTLVLETNFTDSASAGRVYMVRAVKLETSASGTYTNLSQGIFEDLGGRFSPPYLTLTLPTNTTSFSLGSSIVMTVETSDANNDILQVDYYTNGVWLGSSSIWPYGLTWSNAWLGAYALTAAARDAAGLSATSAVANVFVTFAVTNLAATRSLWKYYGLTNDLGVAWCAPEYDDSSWSNGLAQLGFGDGDEATTLVTNPLRITTYFRKAFVPPSNGMFLGLTVSLLRDDGAVVYLNGDEVWRNNMPGGPIVWGTFASTNVGGPDETSNFYYSAIPLSKLHPGTNIFAVEVHQAGTNSSDLSFDLGLIATNLPAASNTPPILSSLPDLVTDEDVPASMPFVVGDRECWPEGISLAATSSNPGLVPPASVSFSGTGSNRVLVIFPATNQSGGARITLTASDGLASATNSFTLTVNPVEDPPSFAWVGLTNGATVGPGAVILNAGATDPEGNLALVEYFADGEKIGEATAAPFTFTWASPSMGYHRVQACATDSTGLRACGAALFLGVRGGGVTFINPGALWKYWDSGPVPASNWFTLAFDDSAWLAGPSPLGYGDANGTWPATTNSFGPDPANRFITTYYRCAFTNDFSAVTTVLLFLQRDDGAVIYLNGAEVFRSNMPTGAVSYATLASSAAEGADETAWRLTPVNSALPRYGVNLLAAEVHQCTNDSPDLFFNLRLTAQPVLQPPALTALSGDGLLELSWPSWAAGLSLWSATNLQPPIAWTEVPEAVLKTNGQLRVSVPIESQLAKFFQLRSW